MAALWVYALFLDSGRQYSCAYFENPQASLDDAQLAKKRHLAAICLIEEGHRLLDLGCGFGGLALYAAECCGAHATGIALPQEQLAKARRRADAPRAASGRPHSVPRPRLSRRLGAISRTKFEAQLPMERSVVGDADKQQRVSVGSAVATAGAAILRPPPGRFSMAVLQRSRRLRAMRSTGDRKVAKMEPRPRRRICSKRGACCSCGAPRDWRPTWDS